MRVLIEWRLYGAPMTYSETVEQPSTVIALQRKIRDLMRVPLGSPVPQVSYLSATAVKESAYASNH